MSVHLLLSAGRGPRECAWALAELLRRLEADATRQGLETCRAETVPGDRPGTYRTGIGRKNWYVTAVRATHRPSGIVVVVDTERQFSLNRRLAMRLLRQRLKHGDEVAGRAVTTARRRIHDELVRGDPTRIERPRAPEQDHRGGRGRGHRS